MLVSEYELGFVAGGNGFVGNGNDFCGIVSNDEDNILLCRIFGQTTGKVAFDIVYFISACGMFGIVVFAAFDVIWVECCDGGFTSIVRAATPFWKILCLDCNGTETIVRTLGLNERKLLYFDAAIVDGWSVILFGCGVSTEICVTLSFVLPIS